jgi:RNA polymerase sigma-70 factor (ECF subfamily)
VSLLEAPDLPDSFAPYEEWRRRCGFVPAVLRAQTLLPRAIEAESQLAFSVLDRAVSSETLDGVLVSALMRLLRTTASALEVACDVTETTADVPMRMGPRDDTGDALAASFNDLERTFGFVPAVFRAQAARPDALAAEALLVDAVLGAHGALPRRRKEAVLLAVAAAMLNTSCAALHAEMLRTLGVDEDLCDQVTVDYRQAGLPASERALVDMAVHAARGGSARDALASLRSHGFSDQQILEAIIASALGVFLTTLQSGLATPPDFSPRHVFAAAVTPDPPVDHPADPDAQLVDRARSGDVSAFEELVRRHHRRIYRAALAVTGNEADAEDAAQVAFVKAFNALDSFERQARFTSWLTRIAINEAVSRVRARRPAENLPLEQSEETFRPSIVGAWPDNPEQLYARRQMKTMIERALSDMPVKYRMAVLLRDVEQLNTADAASALGIPVPTLKKHVLRGRLLLREALAPHFATARGALPGV